MTSDLDLLEKFARQNSQDAFNEIVRRHVDLVYSAALRMVCDAHLGEDVTQGAFVALARNARRLTDHSVLSGCPRNRNSWMVGDPGSFKPWRTSDCGL